MMKDKRVIIEDIKVYESMYMQDKEQPLIHNTTILHEAVEHLVLKPEGKKPMSRKEFLNGYLK